MSETPDESQFVAAGDFREWLSRTRAFLQGQGGSDVPCGDCVGCCVSSYHIVIRPEDQAGVAHLPEHLRRSAPGMAPGHWLMAYLPDGACPMLRAGECSIYRDRPQTCRDYDCRIFAAAGIDAGGADKGVINARVRAWRFSYPDPADRRAHAAVLAAAAFVRDKRSSFPGARAPSAPTGIAVLAIKAHEVFLDPQQASRSDAQTAAAIIQASRRFDAVALKA